MSRIAANSQRFRATVWLREFWSRFHSDSLRDSVMGYQAAADRGYVQSRAGSSSADRVWSRVGRLRSTPRMLLLT